MTRTSRRFLAAGLALTLAVAALYGWARLAAGTSASFDARGAEEFSDADLVARGAYVARLGDCAGCHTAPDPDSPPFAGGRPMRTPFGIIYATNITPALRTGIGEYRYGDFERAVRQGVAPGGRRLYPAMPYPSFTKISDADIRALYAYFMHGVQPVEHQTPETRLPFPLNQRWGLMFWDLVFVRHGRFEPAQDRDQQWIRGAYLTQSLGHCGACHTPRGPAFAERGYDESSATYLTGGINENWHAPNLNGDSGAGLGRLSQQNIVSYLRTGHGDPMHIVASGSMVPVIEHSTQYFSEEDLFAIARYLKSLPARGTPGGYQPQAPRVRKAPDGPLSRVTAHPGAGVYLSMCARCHRSDGGGKPAKFPALAGNPGVLSSDATTLIRVVLEGGTSPQTHTGPEPREMPAFADKLTDTEIARVLSFVRSAWGNQASPVTAPDVARLRERLAH